MEDALDGGDGREDRDQREGRRQHAAGDGARAFVGADLAAGRRKRPNEQARRQHEADGEDGDPDFARREPDGGQPGPGAKPRLSALARV